VSDDSQRKETRGVRSVAPCIKQCRVALCQPTAGDVSMVLFSECGSFVYATPTAYVMKCQLTG
jgi:hypothetical protein